MFFIISDHMVFMYHIVIFIIVMIDRDPQQIIVGSCYTFYV